MDALVISIWVGIAVFYVIRLIEDFDWDVVVILWALSIIIMYRLEIMSLETKLK